MVGVMPCYTRLAESWTGAGPTGRSRWSVRGMPVCRAGGGTVRLDPSIAEAISRMIFPDGAETGSVTVPRPEPEMAKDTGGRKGPQPSCSSHRGHHATTNYAEGVWVSTQEKKQAKTQGEVRVLKTTEPEWLCVIGEGEWIA